MIKRPIETADIFIKDNSDFWLSQQPWRAIHLTFTTPAPRAGRRSIQLHICLGRSRVRVSLADGLLRVPLNVRGRFNLLLDCCVKLGWHTPSPCLLCLSTRPRRALLSSRGMFWPRLSARWREVRVVLGVARGPRGFQFVAAFLPCVFRLHSPCFSIFRIPRAVRCSRQLEGCIDCF